MSHTDHVRGTRPKRQLLDEYHHGKRGQTRAQRADQGREVAIAESLAIAEDRAFWYDEVWDTVTDCY